MLFAIDVGNTSINMGLFEGEELGSLWRSCPALTARRTNMVRSSSAMLQRHGIPISSIQARSLQRGSSLVPVFSEVCTGTWTQAPVVGRASRPGCALLVDNPASSGRTGCQRGGACCSTASRSCDRLRHGHYIRCGLAGGDFLGGAIAPASPSPARRSFPHRDAATNRPSAPQACHWTCTVTAMQSGILFGYIAWLRR